MKLQIKVCGMREPENIRALNTLDVDMMGLIFYPKSTRYVRSIPVSAGIVPDRAASLLRPRAKLVGVFVNEMPQTVVTHAYNYRLDYIQLHGNETPTSIDNLKRTLIPDILPDVKIIKAISIREADDVKRWRQYEGHIDLLLFDTKCKTIGGSGEQFDWSVLSAYDGDIPFLLSGGIGPQDAESIRQFKHPMFAGIDVNSKFEDAPAHKDIDKLQNFISSITQ